MTDVFQQHGAFSWCELTTTDPAAAKHFYRELFGWEMQDVRLAKSTYTVLSAEDTEVGGIMAAHPEVPGAAPHWGCYVTVVDVDATAATARRLGGQVLVPPTDIPAVGRYCVLQDAQGAVISAITYALP